jgi:hypothetical protein
MVLSAGLGGHMLAAKLNPEGAGHERAFLFGKVAGRSMYLQRQQNARESVDNVENAGLTIP